MSQKQINVLIVDDSAFMRKALSMMLESDPGIKVIGTARDGEEGVQKVKTLKPDLVTMDVEMPRMDGLAALRQIMATCPVPVMMVSSITSDGAEATLEALELGAVDFIPKQMSYVSLDIVKIQDDLLAKIKDIARRRHILMARFHQRRQFANASKTTVKAQDYTRTVSTSTIKKRRHKIDLVAIGSSTGGPPALQTVISTLPRTFPVGIVIAQHMPPMFTKSLAERLNDCSAVTVREATNGETIEPGLVLIAPGGQHIVVKKYGGRPRVVVTDEPSEALYKPCVDVLMNSVANEFGASTLGVILTGMGSNGVDGARLLKDKGGILIAQDEATSIVYGMPRAVNDAKLSDHIAPIERIQAEITSYF